MFISSNVHGLWKTYLFKELIIAFNFFFMKNVFKIKKDFVKKMPYIYMCGYDGVINCDLTIINLCSKNYLDDYFNVYNLKNITIDNIIDFNKIDNIRLICNSLKNIETEYVLILIGEDFFINDLKSIVNNFNCYGKKMLFACRDYDSSVRNKSAMESISNTVNDNTIDSKCCFGKTSIVKSFYEKINIIREVFDVKNFKEITADGLTETGMNGFIINFVDDIEASFDERENIGYDYDKKIFDLN